MSSFSGRSFRVRKCVPLFHENDYSADIFAIGVVLYAIGIVELQLESTSALILLIFIIPLAFTLSGFLLWIMHSLNGMPIGSCVHLVTYPDIIQKQQSHICERGNNATN